jgi:hypothetical protein
MILTDSTNATCAFANSNVAQTLRDTRSVIKAFVLINAWGPTVPSRRPKSTSSVLTRGSATGRPIHNVSEISVPHRQAWNGE